jgi:hypothetical protein
MPSNSQWSFSVPSPGLSTTFSVTARFPRNVLTLGIRSTPPGPSHEGLISSEQTKAGKLRRGRPEDAKLRVRLGLRLGRKMSAAEYFPTGPLSVGNSWHDSIPCATPDAKPIPWTMSSHPAGLLALVGEKYQ